MDGVQVDFVESLVQNSDVVFALGGEYFVGGSDLLYFCDNVFIVRRGYLRSVGPVCLVAVVFLGVVRCRDYYPALASQPPDRETEFRGRT